FFCDAGPQPHNHVQRSLVGEVHTHRKPERVVGEPAEARRHHAYYRARYIVQHQLLADGIDIAVKFALPESIIQYDHRFGRAIRPDIEGFNRTTNKRLYAKEVEGVAGD